MPTTVTETFRTLGRATLAAHMRALRADPTVKTVKMINECTIYVTHESRDLSARIKDQTCGRCIIENVKPQGARPIGCVFIAIGPCVWGKGATLAAAWQKARAAGGPAAGIYAIYLCEDPAAHVTEMGGIAFASGTAAPRMVAKVKNGRLTDIE